MKNRIRGIGAIKGIAALIIAQYHMYFFGGEGLPFEHRLRLGYRYGWVMVELFFLLSGFLMYHSYAARIARGEKGFTEFVYGRLSRLYGPFVVTLFVAAVIVYINHVLELGICTGASTVVNFVLSLGMIHYAGFNAPQYSFDIPAWFISAIFLCYIVFYFVAKAGKTKGKQLLGIFLMILLGLICQRVYALFPNVYFPLVNLDIGRALVSFFVGGAIAYIYNYTSILNKRNTTFIWVGLIVVSYYALKRLDDATFELIIGDTRQFCSLFLFPAFVLAVLGTEPMLSFLECKVLRFIGMISYEIFLWHFIIIQGILICSRVFSYQIPYSHPLFFFAYFALVIGVSAMAYYFIEIPVGRWFASKQNKVLLVLQSPVE